MGFLDSLPPDGITINTEINFHEQDVASIFYETNVARREVPFAELCFTGAFAIRMMSNLRANETTDMIGHYLKMLARLIRETPQELSEQTPKLIDYPGTPGRKRFIGNLRLGPQRMQLDFKAKEFEFFARGVGYYGPGHPGPRQRGDVGRLSNWPSQISSAPCGAIVRARGHRSESVDLGLHCPHSASKLIRG